MALDHPGERVVPGRSMTFGVRRQCDGRPDAVFRSPSTTTDQPTCGRGFTRRRPVQASNQRRAGQRGRGGEEQCGKQKLSRSSAPQYPVQPVCDVPEEHRFGVALVRVAHGRVEHAAAVDLASPLTGLGLTSFSPIDVGSSVTITIERWVIIVEIIPFVRPLDDRPDRRRSALPEP